MSAEQRGEDGGAGGDFYTIAVRTPGRIGVVIGDACGRGTDGHAQLALVSSKVHELARSGAMPGRLLTELNLAVARELPLDRFVTAAAFELDLGGRLLTVANAAHVPAVVRREGRITIVGRASGPPLGFSRETTYREEQTSLRPRDLIVLMTDGVLEAVESDLSAMSTLSALLEGTTAGAAGVHRLLLERFTERTAGRRADDMTLIAIEPMGRPLHSKARRVATVNSCALSS